MLNFLKFLINTNITHYSKENYDYFLHLQNLKSSIYFEYSVVSEKIDFILTALYHSHLGIEFDKNQTSNHIHFLFLHLKNDKIFKSNSSNLQNLYTLLLEFYKFNIIDIYTLNSFLILHLELNKERSFLDIFLSIIDKTPYIFKKSVLNYREFNNFIFTLLDFCHNDHLKYIFLYKETIKQLFSEEDCIKLFDFLSKKENIVKIFPIDFLSYISNKISNEYHPNDFDLFFAILKQCEKEDNDYYTAKNEILMNYPDYTSIFEEYEIRLNIENF